MNIKPGKCRVTPMGGGPERNVELGRPACEKDTVLIADDVPHKEVQVVPTLTVEMSGIVDLCPWNDPPLLVNDIDIIEALEKELTKCSVQPVRDTSSRFAGQVTISIRMTGDLEEKEATS